MLSHDTIWTLIDRLAQEQGLTPSGLARLAGLDPTTFNPSKRFKPDGRPRWPSTESIAKILDATQTAPNSFFSLGRRLFSNQRDSQRRGGFTDAGSNAETHPASFQMIRKPIGLMQQLLTLASGPVEDKADPCDMKDLETKSLPLATIQPEKGGTGQQDYLPFPLVDSQRVLAVEMEDEVFSPCYPAGCYLLLHPLCALKVGERLLFCVQGRAPMIGQIRTADKQDIEIEALGLLETRLLLERSTLIWWARILWASQ